MKTRFIALAVVATMGLGTVSAFAQDYHRDGRAAGGWQHQRAEQGRRDWAYNNNHRYDGYRRDNGDVGAALVLGALTGALAANAYSPPATAYYPPATAYYNPPAYYNPGTTYYSPGTTYYNPGTTYYNPGNGYYGN